MAEEEDGNEIESAQTGHVFNGYEIRLLISDLKKQERRRPTETDKECVKIQKVPESIKVCDGQHYYTPREISIGPIHAGKEELVKRDLKLRLAARFVEYSGRSNEDLISSVIDDFDAIKNYYEESVVESFSDDALLSLLLLDAFFVLQFIDDTVQKTNEFGISTGLQNSIQHDLFLLENQLPLYLLLIVASTSDNRERMVRSILTFIDMNSLSPDHQNMKFIERFWGLISRDRAHHLLDLLRINIWSPKKQHPNILERPRSFRNVQDLKLAGITIKPSESSTFNKVSFSRWWFFNATLRLPVLIVDSSTASKLLNMAAFEMCLETWDFRVSSYFSFMDSLVDTEQDVSDLRAAQVLRNRLGSDLEVAKLFNEIGSNLVTNDEFLYLQHKIQKHYESKLALWWAQFRQDYFSSPWKAVALIGGVLVLLFGGLSAFYTMFPRKDRK